MLRAGGSAGASAAVQGELFGHALGLELRGFCEFGRRTEVRRTHSSDGSVELDAFVNEFWTSRQRAAHSLHEVSFRACFKPQLPRFFIDRLTRPGDRVYDPFMGRGTTLLEAALLGRVPLGCDVSPLSRILVEPRLRPPALGAVSRRLRELDLGTEVEHPSELEVFYHPDTLGEVCCLREYMLGREREGTIDDIDRWIRTVAVNRLTGHSPGFFSVYTLPPNQAVSPKAQRKINQRRGQIPPRRDVKALILRKSRSLLADCDDVLRRRLSRIAEHATLLTRPCDQTPQIEDRSVRLVVTSPPFLDVVDYGEDNWLRCWFCGIEPSDVPMTNLRRVEEWQAAMTAALSEFRRVLEPGGHVAFEVGEVRGGKILLDEVAVTAGRDAGLRPELVVINDQDFTKTANCWGVSNNRKGTNSNRIALFRK